MILYFSQFLVYSFEWKTSSSNFLRKGVQEVNFLSLLQDFILLQYFIDIFAEDRILWCLQTKTVLLLSNLDAFYHFIFLPNCTGQNHQQNVD